MSDSPSQKTAAAARRAAAGRVPAGSEERDAEELKIPSRKTRRAPGAQPRGREGAHEEEEAEHGHEHNDDRDAEEEDLEQESSTANSEDIRSLPQKLGGNQKKQEYNRPKPGLGSLKLDKYGGPDEESKGGLRYKRWKKDL